MTVSALGLVLGGSQTYPVVAQGSDELPSEPPALSDGSVNPQGHPASSEPLTTAPSANTETASDPETNSTPSAPARAENAEAAIRFVTPEPNALLEVPAATVTLQYPIGSEVTFRANGTPVGDDLIGRTATDPTTGLITQTWYGVGLQPGMNQLSARGQWGETDLGTVTLQVQVRGEVTRLVITTLESRVPADGRSTVTVQGQLIDAQGNVASQDTVITLEASQGTFIGEDQNPGQRGFQVQTQNGEFSAPLQAGLTPGPTTIRATGINLEAYTQVQFMTELRPTLMTGVVDVRLGARGTDFYSSFRDFLPADGGGTELAVRGGAFAVTSFGDWRFTGAYRSDRSLNEGCDGTVSLFRDMQPCDRAYPTYGDESTSEVLAPSIDSLYLRFERTSPVPNAGSDYFMWGDFHTEAFAIASQRYSAINRSLHGFSGSYNLGNLQLAAIYGNNIDGFQRDTLAPDGTSGFYFLSRRLLIPGSEAVYFELSELNRPGLVLDRQQLSRGADYEIDYDRGTLLFRQPVQRTVVDGQGQILVRRIVATYQYEGGNNTSLYGGRLRYHFTRDRDQGSWLGATYLQENQTDQQFQLYGVDAQVSFGSTGQLVAEYARSTNRRVNDATSGEAYRLEVANAFGDSIWARAYWQQVSPGFANNATISFVPGQRRYGAELRVDLSTDTSLRFGFDHQTTTALLRPPSLPWSPCCSPAKPPSPANR